MEAVNVVPTAYKGDDVIHTFLKHTPLERFFDVEIPFVLPEETRFSGHWIIAPPGRGKTTLLHSMVMEDLKKDACIILMDSKGDLTEPFRTMKDIQDRLIIIDPSLEHPIGFNPLDVPQTEVNQSIELLEYLFSSLLEFKLTPAQMSLFRNVLRALVTAFPNPTLETFRDILANGVKKYEQLIKTLPADLQDFFATDFNEDTTRARRREVVQRLSLLLGNDIMRAMFTAATHVSVSRKRWTPGKSSSSTIQSTSSAIKVRSSSAAFSSPRSVRLALPDARKKHRRKEACLLLHR